MGKFTDTKFTNTIDNLVVATKDKINNPYYVYNDQHPTKVTYYAQNIEKSTIDEASGLYDSHVGTFSSFKFNKINNFIIYGIDKISTEYDVAEFGTEAVSITGDAVILPNTISPRPGDFFAISYVKEPILFKVNAVSPDTLDSGANIYRLEYAVELTNSIDIIEKQIVKEFEFVVNNVGTDFKAVVESSDYKLIDNLENLVEELITYFDSIFYNNHLQTLVYNHDGWHMYDPFMIEFLIRNSVLSFSDSYVYLHHAAATNKTFHMDYTRTFFYNLENHNTQDVKPCTMATADLITDINSLFISRMDDYYMVKYFDNLPYKTRFEVFNNNIIDHIRNNKMFKKGDSNECYNLWIAYFNNDKDFINGDILSLIKSADYMNNLNCFYFLGISIFIIEQYIKGLLSK